MAQHDYVIANGTGAAVRSDLNNALAAIVSQNSGATEPATMYAYQWWADTTTGLLKLRNGANNAWITLRELDGTLTIEAGTVSAPGLAFASDLNTGVWSPGADQFAIATNGVERVEWGTSEVVFNDGGANYDFRIEGDTNANLFFVDASAEAVGIGTTSPASKFQVTDASGDTQIDGGSIYANRSDGFYLQASSYLRIYTNGAERARIDSSGRLLVGTSSSQDKYYNTTGNGHLVQIESTSVVLQSSTVHSGTNPTGGAHFAFARSRGTAVGSVTSVASGDSLVRLSFQGADGTEFVEAATITCDVDGTPGANDMPGRLVFSTTADGASSPTERMRIDNAGNTFIKVMQVGGTANVHWSSSAGQLFVTSSSLRFKNSVEEYDKGLAEVMQMQPKYFVYNQEPSGKKRAGFIAEDFHDLGLTEYVEYWKGEEGEDLPSEIGYSNMVAILVKAIQELKAEVDDLKSQLS